MADQALSPQFWKPSKQQPDSAPEKSWSQNVDGMKNTANVFPRQ